MAIGTPAQDELFERLTELLSTHDVHPDERHAIQQAWLEHSTWDELPDEIKAMVERAEQLPVQSWDDPFDVPDDLS